jgi:hypothetical protein
VEDKCTLCNQIHLNTLPPRIRNLLSSSVVDQFEICRLNHAETHIVPDGLSKNYPKNIDFDKLPDRIDNLFSELFDIVIRKTKSIYRDTAIKIYNELGNGARKPIVVMGRFEIFQVRLKILFLTLIKLSKVNFFASHNSAGSNFTKPKKKFLSIFTIRVVVF